MERLELSDVRDHRILKLIQQRRPASLAIGLSFKTHLLTIPGAPNRWPPRPVPEFRGDVSR
jgi:hypothetical protein